MVDEDIASFEFWARSRNNKMKNGEKQLDMALMVPGQPGRYVDPRTEEVWCAWVDGRAAYRAALLKALADGTS